MTKGVRRRPARHAQPLAPDHVDGGRRRVHLGAADLNPADRVLVRLAVARRGCRTRSAASTGTASDDTYTTCYVPLYCGIDRVARVVHGRQPRQLLVGFRLVGVQFRCQLRQPALRRHDRRYPGRAGRTGGDAVRPCSRRWRSVAVELAASDQELLTRYPDGLFGFACGRWSSNAGAPWVSIWCRSTTTAMSRTRTADRRNAATDESWLRKRPRSASRTQFRLPEKPADVPESKLID